MAIYFMSNVTVFLKIEHISEMTCHTECAIRDVLHTSHTSDA